MYIRLLVVIVWMAGIGSWGSGGSDPARSSAWAVTSQFWGEGWLPGENLADLVAYHARRRQPRPSRGPGSRRKAARGKRRGGKKPGSFRLRPTAQAGLPGKVKPQLALPEAEMAAAEGVLAPRRWGLSPELSQELPDRLFCFWQRYVDRFKTKTRDTSVYAYHYLSGLLRLENKRDYTHIGQAAGVAGENVQHFMSNSPWSAQVAVAQARQEIKATPGLQQGSVLILDESADQTAGEKRAGAGRQYNGRLGKVELSIVGVFLAYANLTGPHRPLWTWVAGDLYLPEQWFDSALTELRQRVGLPPERRFATKIELGWKMIQQLQAEGLPFEAVVCDDLYGQSSWFRDQMAGAGIVYMADVPSTTHVYLDKPALGVPDPLPGRRGRKPTRLRVLSGAQACTAQLVASRADTSWHRVRVRPTERGVLDDPFTARRVWTVREGQAEPVEEWLVIRREGGNRLSYALSNAPADAPLAYLAWLKCQRYFVERANQDAKSEIGWDEFRAQKYRGWEHHLALTILAAWFVAQTLWEWAGQYARDPALAQQFEVEVLPALSMANFLLLLRAAMPVPQPTPEQAVRQVAVALINRTRSRQSRLKRQQALSNANAPP